MNLLVFCLRKVNVLAHFLQFFWQLGSQLEKIIDDIMNIFS